MAENNFPNSYETAGSLISMFTSKLPTATRVLYPPDILQGSDTIQHFPGILKSQGYYNAEISVDYYGDVTSMNLKDGFDFVNGRAITDSPFYSASRRYIPDDVAYFLGSITDEVLDRTFHISYIRSMQNPYTEVMAAAPNLSMDDQHRVDQILSLFNDIDQPLFIHVYMMGTHLGTLVGYDDAIHNFDAYMQQITSSLAQMGKLENTIIILYTDNGFNETSNERIPLLIRFPNAQYTGTIHNNTQNLDIGPTVLDYLGIRQPAWMGGQSLLKGEPSADRAIFSAAPNYLVGNIRNELQIDTSKTKPPFNQFGRVGMVVCQKWYQLDTSQLAWQQGNVNGYTGQCDPSTQPADAQARQMLIDQMKKDGFDVSSLEPATDPNPGQ
jgi:phosphoglycerol transferase MdoB-like AlkP superfamily enzyme